MPAAASHGRSPESPGMFPSYPNATAENEYSSHCQSPSSVTMQSCQSPKLARLHQQVTQFKLLKLAQNQGQEYQMEKCQMNEYFYKL